MQAQLTICLKSKQNRRAKEIKREKKLKERIKEIERNCKKKNRK